MNRRHIHLAFLYFMAFVSAYVAVSTLGAVIHLELIEIPPYASMDVEWSPTWEYALVSVWMFALAWFWCYEIETHVGHEQE